MIEIKSSLCGSHNLKLNVSWRLKLIFLGLVCSISPTYNQGVFPSHSRPITRNTGKQLKLEHYVQHLVSEPIIEFNFRNGYDIFLNGRTQAPPSAPFTKVSTEHSHCPPNTWIHTEQHIKCA